MRNSAIFEEGVPSVQKMKNSFVYALWSLARVLSDYQNSDVIWVLESSGCGLGDWFSVLPCFVGFGAGTVFFSFFLLSPLFGVLICMLFGLVPFVEYFFCCLPIKKKRAACSWDFIKKKKLNRIKSHVLNPSQLCVLLCFHFPHNGDKPEKEECYCCD